MLDNRRARRVRTIGDLLHVKRVEREVLANEGHLASALHVPPARVEHRHAEGPRLRSIVIKRDNSTFSERDTGRTQRA